MANVDLCGPAYTYAGTQNVGMESHVEASQHARLVHLIVECWLTELDPNMGLFDKQRGSRSSAAEAEQVGHDYETGG